MKYVKIGAICLLAAYVTATVFFGAKARSANALIDGNGKPTITVEDSATANTIMRLKGDVTTGALIVSGIGLSACATIEIDKTTIAATSVSTISASATSTWLIIKAESSNATALYYSNAAAPTADTGIELLPATGDALVARETALYVANTSGSQATATVIWCY